MGIISHAWVHSFFSFLFFLISSSHFHLGVDDALVGGFVTLRHFWCSRCLEQDLSLLI